MATGASAQWLDDFDSYAPGPLCAQSVWDEWTGKSGVDADVVNNLSFTPANSVVIVKDNDVVYDFANLASGRPTSGVWTASAMTFVPAGATGIGWYILMNDYPTNLQWSVQTTFDATMGKVLDGAVGRRLIYNRWVEFVVAIDLDNDRYDSWYNGLSVAVNHSWKGTTGQDVIAALDLYGDAGGLSGMNFDETRLEKTAGGPLMLNATPDPISAGQTLKLSSQSPLLNTGDLGALFTWEVNGTPFILPLLTVSFDATGSWTLSSSVPSGLSGIEVGLKMFALPYGGKIMMSNEELIVFK
jgi:hypothetical protein